ncbi:ATP-binding protein [Caldimonas sp. KR1-144]|uniref:ATP-binding protein n=1 Tax=Caldimonas sp. KR1-144 TaxID=3400911 RepID=UPI003C0756C1
MTARLGSLRVRLLLGLLAAVGGVWLLWIGVQWLMLRHESSGWWDRWLRNAGQELLRSMPATLHEDVDRLREGGGYRLPPGIAAQRDAVSFQIWSTDGRLLLRSPDAPPTPLIPIDAAKPDAIDLVTVNGDLWRAYAVSDAGSKIVVQVAKSRAQIAHQLALWAFSGIAVAAAMVLLLGAVAWAIVRWSLRPVNEVRSALVRRDSLDMRPVPTQQVPDELRPLIRAFNQLLARLDTALQSERRLIADAAHELRTPLAVLMAQAELARSAETLEQARDAITPLMRGIERSSRLTEQLLDMARVDASSAEDERPEVALHELVAHVAQEFAELARRERKTLQVEVEACVVRGDVDAIGVLVRNLVDNALRHGGTSVRVAISCRMAERDGQARPMLVVEDDGIGVPAAERERIFDRFYRVPGTPGSGSGIGLSLVARVAQLHRALIDVGAGVDGRGTRVKVWFPRAAQKL